MKEPTLPDSVPTRAVSIQISDTKSPEKKTAQP